MQVAIINRKDIDFGERRRLEYGNLDGLAASIKEKGLIQPIAVHHRPDAPIPYLLLAGGRRFKATELLGMEELPCRIFDEPVDDLLYREIELIENIERKDLAWPERIKLEKEIHELMVAKHGHKVVQANQHGISTEGWSMRDTSKLLGQSPASTSQDLKLAKAMEEVPEIAECKTKDEAAKMLAKMKERMITEELSRRASLKQATNGVDGAKKKLIDNYVLGDFFNFIKQVPDHSIDFCEIDPPYGVALKEAKKGDNAQASNLDVYNEISADDYKPFLDKLFSECYRVMAENSWLICWFAPEPWAEDVYQALKRAGFSLRRMTGHWIKKTGQTMQPNKYLANCSEPFYYAAKGSPNIARPGRSNLFDYDPVPPKKKIHPTERPIEMIQDILATFCWPGARVMVPFLGSGNSLLACSNLNLPAFGCDLGKEFRDSFVVRVEQGLPGQYRSYTNAVEGLTFQPIE